MTIRKATSIIVFAAAIGLAGSAQASGFGGVTFPTITFADEFDASATKSRAKTKACKTFCKKAVKE